MTGSGEVHVPNSPDESRERYIVSQDSHGLNC